MVRFHYSINSALSVLKFRAKHSSENYVYSLFAFLPLLLTVIGCRPAFFAQYLHKVEECPTFMPLSTLSPRRIQPMH